MSRGIAKAMADVFISYAREDRPKVQLLTEAFEGRGWSVWWDTRLKAGEVWDDVIERELNATRCVVVLWSKASVQKHWVRVEAGEGLERRILVPAFIEDVRPPLAFRLLQAEHLIDWSGDSLHPGLNRLLAAVSERLRAQNLEEINRQPAAEHDLAVFRDVDALWCPEMVALPAGEFLMGSPKNEEERFSNESPQHRVTIRDRFAIGQYPITVGEYRRFVEATAHSHAGGLWDGSSWKVEASKSWRDPGFLQTDRHPVVGVSWWDAQAYIEWLARETGKPYRLPSEAEWEYACRAETKTRYSFGNRIMPKDANYGESNLVRPPRRGASRRTPGVSTTCMATSGSGSRTSGMTATRGRRPTARPGRMAKEKNRRATASTAAVPGTTFRRASVLPTATGTILTVGSPTSAFGLPGRLIRTLCFTPLSLAALSR